MACRLAVRRGPQLAVRLPGAEQGLLGRTDPTGEPPHPADGVIRPAGPGLRPEEP